MLWCSCSPALSQAQLLPVMHPLPPTRLPARPQPDRPGCAVQRRHLPQPASQVCIYGGLPSGRRLPADGQPRSLRAALRCVLHLSAPHKQQEMQRAEWGPDGRPLWSGTHAASTCGLWYAAEHSPNHPPHRPFFSQATSGAARSSRCPSSPCLATSARPCSGEAGLVCVPLLQRSAGLGWGVSAVHCRQRSSRGGT